MSKDSLKHRILFVGLHFDSNKGDQLISEIAIRLYADAWKNKTSEELLYSRLDLRNFVEVKNKRHFKPSLGEKIRYRFFTKEEKFKRGIEIKAFEVENYIKEFSAVVIVGGGLIHYKLHPYLRNISVIISVCEKYDIPVVINSVGIEEYDTHDMEYKVYREYLNKPCVKAFTVRDYLEELKSDWITNNSIYTDCVPDNAILSKDIYKYQYDRKSNVIGIGLIRDNIYNDFHGENKRSDLVDFYVDIVEDLKKRGLSFEFFCNGIEPDVKILSLIEERIGEKYDVRFPHDCDSLVRIISGYKGIITARMHSTIIAYSLGVPYVALSWHKKCDRFAELIGRPEAAVKLGEKTAAECVEKLLEYVDGDYDTSIRTNIETKIHSSIDCICDNLIHPNK